jgi:hypothetical protein
MSRRIDGRIVALVLGTWLGAAGLASATMNTSKKAKEMGFPVTNCTYCHNEKLPKKEAATLNDRGSWLAAQKAKQKAKEVDPGWLKDYADKK